MAYNPDQPRDDHGRWAGGNYAKAVAQLTPAERAALSQKLGGHALGKAVMADLAKRGPRILTSLESQLAIKRKMSAPAAHQLAVEILTAQGTLNAKGQLTAQGRKREALGHEGRMKDRAARQLGRKPHEIGIQNGRPYVK